MMADWFKRLWFISERQASALLAVLLLLLILAPIALSATSYLIYLLFTFFLFAVFGHAWNLMAGYGGLLSFGNQVYIGISGFAMAILFYYGNVNIWLAWLAGGIVATLFAWLLAVPMDAATQGRTLWRNIGIAVVLWILYEIAIVLNPELDVFASPYVRRISILLLIFLGALPLLNLQGAYFAVATWLIAEAVGSIFNEWRVVGAGGGMQVKTEINLIQLYYVALLLAVIATYVVWRLLRSRYGLALTAVRDNEEAAEVVGVDVRRVKVLVFIIAGAFTGLAAGLYYINAVIITPPAAFSIFWSALLVFVVVSGGMGTLAGPLIGAMIYVIVDRIVAVYFDQGLLVLGVIAILFILFLPRGVMGIIHDLRSPRLMHGASQPFIRLRQALLGERLTPVEPERSSKNKSSKHKTASNKTMRTSAPLANSGVVSAFLVSGSPLPLLCPEEPAWKPLADAYKTARASLLASQPDVLLVYSTQWIAVLDQLWQTRAHLHGIHVDENWHEFGDMAFDIHIDTALSEACVNACNNNGIQAKKVDYDAFPIDSGTIVMQHFLNPDGTIPLVIAANNLYHNHERTRELAALAVNCAQAQRKRVALIAVGGLSGTLLREPIEPATDHIAGAHDDEWNRRVLRLLENGDHAALDKILDDYAQAARVDMGGKHISWLLGGLDRRFSGAQVYGYGPVYGSGQAVLEIVL